MKFGWRWFLPVFFIILFVVLAVIHSAGNPSPSSSNQGWSAIEVDPLPVPPDMHALRVLAIPLFLFIPAWLAEQLGASPATRSLLAVAGVVSIPLVWYLVGRWIDSRLGYVPEKSVRLPGKMRQTVTWILLVVMILVFLSLLITFAVDRVGDEDVWLSGFLWTMFFSAVLISKLRRWKILNAVPTEGRKDSSIY